MRRDEREPMGLGAAIGALVTERAWGLPAAGASPRERWATIAPEPAGHVVAVGFGLDSGRLTVCPESSAWATKARLAQARVIEIANKAAGRVVFTPWARPPGAVPVPEPVDVALVAPTDVAVGPVRTREMASPGIHQALAAHQATRTDRHIDRGHRGSSRAAGLRDARAESARVPGGPGW
ncbi:DUF721 domain-containing protein [Streptomyces sp. NPDC056304]|uniref:DUF721 domain-containing protein n=1 Tax=Streptomyces sp. NPDC056304 TaxID=3345778 RepID=UPI0035D7EC55